MSLPLDELLTYLLLSFPLLDFLLAAVPIPVLPSTWDDAVLGILLLLALGRVLLGGAGRQNRFVRTALWVLTAMAGYLVLDWRNFGASLEGYRAAFEYVAAFFAAYYLLRDRRQLRAYLAALLGLGILMALHGIYQFLVAAPTPGHWLDAAEDLRTRAFSIVGSPNALGSHMALLAPLALAFALGQANWRGRILWLLAAVLLGGGLIVTFSRGAWLAGAAALGVLGVLYDRRLLVAGLIGAVMAVAFVTPVRERVGYLLSSQYWEKSQHDGRIARWLSAYDQMRAHPVLGDGLGHYGGAVAQRRFGTTYVDNDYMKTLAETGLTGLGLFLLLIVSVLLEGYRSWRRTRAPDQRLVALGLLASLVALATHNGVENIFEIPYLNTYFWLLAGWLLALPDLPAAAAPGAAKAVAAQGEAEAAPVAGAGEGPAAPGVAGQPAGVTGSSPDEAGTPGPGALFSSWLPPLLLALYLFISRAWWITPATLDGSLLGVLCLVAVAGAACLPLPAARRRPLLVFLLGTLLLQRSIESLNGPPAYPPLAAAAASLLSLAVVAVLCRLLGPVPLRRCLPAYAGVVILTWLVPPLTLQLAPHFWTLADSGPTAEGSDVDFEPLVLTDTDRDGRLEVVTRSLAPLNRPAREDAGTADRPAPSQAAELAPAPHAQLACWVVFHYGPDRRREEACRPDPPPGVAWPPDHPNLPYYHRDGSQLVPWLSRQELVEEMTQFGTAPWRATALLRATLPAAGTSLELAEGHFTGPPGARQRVLLDAALRLVDASGRTLASLPVQEEPALARAEALAADVDGDGRDELLLSGPRARILSLAERGWETLWLAPDESFRFESFAALRAGASPQIIALAQSQVRDDPTRFLTGYRYQPGGLQRLWRVFATPLINVRAGDVDGDGQPELIAAVYGQHRFLVLRPHGLPLLPAWLVLTIVLLLLPWYGWWRRRRSPGPGRLAAPALVSALLLLAGGLSLTLGGARLAPAAGAVLEEEARAPGRPLAVDASAEALREALAGSRAAQRFRYQGWIVTELGKRRTTSMYSGLYLGPGRMSTDARLLGYPFQVYREAGHVYMREAAAWYEAGRTRQPVDPWRGFEALISYLAGHRHGLQAVQLPEETVLGRRTRVLRIRLAAGDLAALSAPYAPQGIALHPDGPGGPGGPPAPPRVPPAAQGELTLWLDSADPRIVQVQLRTLWPAGASGVATQETYFRFWDYDSPSVQLTLPKGLRELVAGASAASSAKRAASCRACARAS